MHIKTTNTDEQLLFRALLTHASTLEKKLDTAQDQLATASSAISILYYRLFPMNQQMPTDFYETQRAISEELTRRGVPVTPPTNGGGANE
jgi:hypothetical protein